VQEVGSLGPVGTAIDTWAQSGCAWLTGRSNGPPRFEGNGAAVLAANLSTEILAASTAFGVPVDLAGPSLLAERSAHTGFTRGGHQSCNRTTEIMSCLDGSVSFTINRHNDADLLAACFESTSCVGDPWMFARTEASRRTAAEVVDSAVTVGLSAATLGEHHPRSQSPITPFHGSGRKRSRPLVVDLSSLWAGPLAAHILGWAGARVVKVESTNRLDGARFGSSSFYELLHGGHESVTLPFDHKVGQDHLRTLLSQADVVLTSARPRAFEQMGIEPRRFMEDFPISSWVSITAFGANQPHRVGFGDDAAFAAGLCAFDSVGPMFAADAIADPLTGLAAAAHSLRALTTGQRVHVDLALADVASAAMIMAEEREGPVTDVDDETIQRPRLRTGVAVAPPPGRHNDRWIG
jgi:CoA-transferase family III